MKQDEKNQVQGGPSPAEDDRDEELYGLTPAEWAEFMRDTIEQRPEDSSWIGMPRTKEGLSELTDKTARLNRERHSADDPADSDDRDDGHFGTGPAIAGWYVVRRSPRRLDHKESPPAPRLSSALRDAA